jgi:hypothetical protein
VEVVVTTPAALSPGQRAILEEFADLQREQLTGA